MLSLFSLLLLLSPSLSLCSPCELMALRQFSWSFETVAEAGREVEPHVIDCMKDAAEDFWGTLEAEQFFIDLKTCQEGDLDSEQEEITRSSSPSGSTQIQTSEGDSLDVEEKLYYVFFKEAYKQRVTQQVLSNVEGSIKLASKWLPTPEEETTFLMGLSEQAVREWKPDRLQKEAGRAADSLLVRDQFWTFSEFFHGLNTKGWLDLDDTVPPHLFRLFLLELRLEDGNGRFEAVREALVSRLRLAFIFLGLEMLPFLLPPQKNILFLEMLRLSAQSRSLPLLKALLDRKSSLVELDSFKKYERKRAEKPPLHNLFEVLQLIQTEAGPEVKLLETASFFASDGVSFEKYWLGDTPIGPFDSLDDVLREYQNMFADHSKILLRLGGEAKPLLPVESWTDVPLMHSAFMSSYTLKMEAFDRLRGEGELYQDLVPYFRSYGETYDVMFRSIMEGVRKDGGREKEGDFLGEREEGEGEVCEGFGFGSPVFFLGILNLIKICNIHLVVKSARVGPELLSSLARAVALFELEQSSLFPIRVIAAFLELVGKKALQELLQFNEHNPQSQRLPPQMLSFFRSLSNSILESQLLLYHLKSPSALRSSPHLLGTDGAPLFSPSFVYRLVTMQVQTRQRPLSASRALGRVIKALTLLSQAGAAIAARGVHWVSENHVFLTEFFLRAMLRREPHYRGLEGRRASLLHDLVPSHPRSGSPRFPLCDSRLEGEEPTSSALVKVLCFRYLFCSSAAAEPACVGYSADERAQGLEVPRVLLLPECETGEWILGASRPLFLSGVEVDPEEAKEEARRLAENWGLLDPRAGELAPIPTLQLDELRRAVEREEDELRVGTCCSFNDETWLVNIE